MRDPALWTRIANHQFDDGTNPTPFIDRLIGQTKWRRGFAEQAITEYRKYVYLVTATGEFLTPSKSVDEVWHLHLSDKSNYDLVFCREVLRHRLVHRPATGAAGEGDLHAEAYRRCKELYRQEFPLPPHQSHWPKPASKFRRWFTDANPRKKRRRLVYAGLSILGAVTASSAAAAAFVGSMWFNFCMLSFVFLGPILALNGKNGRSDCGGGCGSSGCSGTCGGSCGGGCGGGGGD